VIFAKTGARDRAQAVRYAYQHGLATPIQLLGHVADDVEVEQDAVAAD
jgi:hypothetical protein